jgi:hypothetical protein
MDFSSVEISLFMRYVVDKETKIVSEIHAMSDDLPVLR